MLVPAILTKAMLRHISSDMACEQRARAATFMFPSKGACWLPLKSMCCCGGLQARVLQYPPHLSHPFTRVNHACYILTGGDHIGCE